MGKALDDARGEVGRGIESTEAACGIPTLLKGETLEGVATGMDVEMWRQPVGVVAAITPFNFPAMIPLWFLPYAIACGNTFILKPSERDPRTSARIVELIDGIDQIPAGVVNLVHGARDAVNGLLDHPEIDAISFVGQASTALHVMDRGTKSGKRVQALGGAKNSMVVMDDADLEQAVPAMMQSAFGNAGQRCLAGSVAVIVGDEERRERVRSVLAEAARELPTGPGTDESVICPPMVGRRRPRPRLRRRRPGARGGRRDRRRRPRDDQRRRRADGADDPRRRRPRVRAGPRGAVRPGPRPGRGRRPRRGARVRQRLPLRQRLGDLHRVAAPPSAATAPRSRPG